MLSIRLCFVGTVAVISFLLYEGCNKVGCFLSKNLFYWSELSILQNAATFISEGKKAASNATQCTYSESVYKRLDSTEWIRDAIPLSVKLKAKLNPDEKV